MTKPPFRSKNNPKATKRGPSGKNSKLDGDPNIAHDRVEDCQRSVDAIAHEDEVLLGASKDTPLPLPGSEMIGTFHLHARGFGFLVSDSPVKHGDLFIPARNTGGALTGDRVRATVFYDKYRSRKYQGDRSPYIGSIVEILKRSNQRYAGNLFKRGGLWLVQVDGKILHNPVIIRDPHAKEVKEGDKVIIELITYPTDRAPAEGVILEVLGEHSEPAIEARAILRVFGLTEEFTTDVMDEARTAVHCFDSTHSPKDRDDLTEHLTVTIDPPDAKDFDDAISISRINHDDGTTEYELGVHIADVNYFVNHGSSLDKEAHNRGNSVYLQGLVIPMLPKLLSNGVCSLQEGVNRFCKSVFISYNADGVPVGSRFSNTVIRSSKRLTYLEAQALIDGNLREARQHARSNPSYGRPIIAALQLMEELAKIIRKRRIANGQINLDLPQVRLIFDKSGRVIDAMPEDDAFTHTIIEMFMVEANEAVAHLFESLNVPFMRRIHPDPDAKGRSELRQFARVAGYNIPMNPSRNELRNLLDAVRGKTSQFAVNLAVLKSLSRAEYSPKHVGHFALASNHYTHFTSPIRRYPDLLVHRVLQGYFELCCFRKDGMGGRSQRLIAHDLVGDIRCLDEERLDEIGRHCSVTERNAELAERELREYLVLDLLSQHLGDDFEGTVTGVTGSGVYIQIEQYLIDGLARVSTLPGVHGERWQINERTGALVARRSGRSITIGDRFTVRITHVDPFRRYMELTIVEPRQEKTFKRHEASGGREEHRQAIKGKQSRSSKPKGQRKRKKRF